MLNQENVARTGSLYYVSSVIPSYMCFDSKSCVLLCLENKSSTEKGADENDSAASEGSEAKLRAERSSRALAGRRTSRSGSASSGDGTISLTRKGLLSGTSTLATLAGKTRALAASVLEEIGSLAGESRELVGADGDVPGAGLGGALGRLAVGLVATVSGGDRGLLECVLEGGEIVHGGNLAAANLDETVVGVFLRVLVDKTSRVDGHHVAAIDGRDLVELTLALVATVLRQAGVY